MRRIPLIVAVVALAVGLAACGSKTASNGSTSRPASSPASVQATAGSCTPTAIQPYLKTRGQITVATDNPVYTPWFVNNHPANGKGYESAVAYAVAAKLGFKSSQVKWVYEPFDDSYAPGPKKFDFDINEISYTPERAQEVTFSSSYYADQQALVVLKSGPIVKNHSPAALRTYLYGDQIGTTSLAYIIDQIHPAQRPKPFTNLNDVKEALDTHQIQAFVTDTPTAQYIAAYQVPGATVVGQFPSTGEHFGLLFQKGDKLVACVNRALASMWHSGTIEALERRYLQIYLAIPTIKP
jgi:polar amino acid transport system substrate-binding protein